MIIGIIGFGFVGKAIAYCYDQYIVRDISIPYTASFEDFSSCDAIFICVPSPTLTTGECDSSILIDVLKNLSTIDNFSNITIISKTTAPPSVYEKLILQYPNLVHCPEFLTASNHIADYKNSRYFVLGGLTKWQGQAKEIINAGVKLPDRNFLFTDIKTAALYKYMMNCYLATKVTFMNDFKELADSQGTDWQELKTLASHDRRIGITHMDVPGPDGMFGYGGACFPKDISAIINEADNHNIELKLMKSVEHINKKHRNKNNG